jgi:hypothetical protein
MRAHRDVFQIQRELVRFGIGLKHQCIIGAGRVHSRLSGETIAVARQTKLRERALHGQNQRELSHCIQVIELEREGLIAHLARGGHHPVITS